MKLVVWIKEVAASGPYLDVRAQWFTDENQSGEYTASAINFSQDPATTQAAIKQAFADYVNTEISSELSASDVLLK